MLKMFVVLLLLLPATCFADITLEKYENTPGIENMMTFYMQGVGKGLEYANSSLKLSKKKRLFCLPETSEIKYKNILDISLGASNYSNELKKVFTVEFVLFETLRTHYPCPEDSKKTSKKK